MNDAVEIPEPPSNNVQAYKLIFCFENVLREFIIEQFDRHCGIRWHKTRLPPDIYQKFVAAKQYERNVKWTSVVPHHPIYYVDFPDIRKIIEQKNNWNDVFQDVFKQKCIVSDALFSLDPIRNTIAHNRLLSTSDLLQLKGCHQRLVTLVGADNYFTLLRRTNKYVSLSLELNRLMEELLSTHETVINFHVIEATPTLEKSLSWWWLDRDYLGMSVDGIEQYRLALVEYTHLPRGWGAGLALERWTKNSSFSAIFEKAQGQLAQLIINIGGQLDEQSAAV